MLSGPSLSLVSPTPPIDPYSNLPIGSETVLLDEDLYVLSDSEAHAVQDSSDFQFVSDGPAEVKTERVAETASFAVLSNGANVAHYFFCIVIQYSDGTFSVTVMGRLASGDQAAAVEALKSGFTKNTYLGPRKVTGRDSIAALVAAAKAANVPDAFLLRWAQATGVPFTLGYSKPCLVAATKIWDAVKDLGE